MSSVPSVAKSRVGHCLVAAFSGDMDYLNGPMFRTEFLSLIDFGERFIVLDLAGVPFFGVGQGTGAATTATEAHWRRQDS
ncbi:STAS domain-containing protein [Streptomyces sp. NPDC048191]|uniref:STAS domain-containing protein n=1 Tax=Streptomyces sp. NPDC048191 TaxID=3155484 RepID=UPI0033D9EFF9